MDGIGGWARSVPDATAIVSLGRTLSFGELDERQRSLIGALRAMGIAERDRIAILSANRAEYLEVTTGCLRAGIVPVPINPLSVGPEIGYIVEDSGARVMISDRPVELRPGLESLVMFGDAYERLLHEADGDELPAHARGRPMHYTSGTTGAPKGVWVDPSPERRAAELSRAFRTSWGLQDDERHLVVSPLSHSAPHRFALRTLEAGGAVMLIGRFDAPETLAAIELFGATSTFMVPTHLERIMALGHAARRRHDLSSVRLLAHAGAPIRAGTKRAAMDLFPSNTVWEFYGSTEGQATRISPEEWLAKPGSVGRAPSDSSVEIRDDDLHLVPPGATGDIWIRDPGAEPFEYWGDDDKTAAAWRDGAFTVGDQGWLDEDGYLYLTGRKHDTIISGGVNVYPQEVERVLEEHPAIAEAMVFGAPDPEWGQRVDAQIVLAETAALDLEELGAWLRARLASFKCPRGYEKVDELPRTATGKLIRTHPLPTD
ncbi:MAG: AMP-binding protein [Actinomycetota bacterium]|nr:AMP-binding protein [Actinomycetota bacterium]